MECLLGRHSENLKTKNAVDQKAGPGTEERKDVHDHDLFHLWRRAEVVAASERRKKAKVCLVDNCLQIYNFFKIKNLKKTEKNQDLVLAHVLEVRKTKNPIFEKNLTRKKDVQRRGLKQELRASRVQLSSKKRKLARTDKRTNQRRAPIQQVIYLYVQLMSPPVRRRKCWGNNRQRN